MAKKFSELQARMSRQDLEFADRLYEHHLQLMPLHKLRQTKALHVGVLERRLFSRRTDKD
jgi:uncharacterized protein (DUF305 family)